MASNVRIVSVLLLSLAVGLVGCGKKTKNEAKPAKDKKDPVQKKHAKGPHGGHLFDIGKDHEIMGELVLKDGKLELYIVDHNDNKKAVLSGSKTITITAIKHGGKSIEDITLEMKPLEGEKDGSSHFVAAKVPKEIDDADALHGAKFKVTIGGKEIQATIEAEHKD